ncbi:hypothetical protein [Candidatus Poriferisocius sp.]|uniref:hypothetical protein n=1 Tax=Candidatus Poriferisocius sp. TaxID=3101276 RepID=UPI003B0154D0
MRPGFAAETALLNLLAFSDRDTEASYDSVLAFVAEVAEDMGWTTTDGGERRAPSDSDVAWSLFDIRQVWEACDLVAFQRSWRDRRFTLTEVGKAAALSYLRRVIRVVDAGHSR